MKKIISFSVLLLAGISLAQNAYNFKTRLDYVFPGFNETNEEILFVFYYISALFTVSTLNFFVHFQVWMFGQAGYTFIYGNQFLNVEGDDLENNFAITKMEYYGYGKAVES